MAVERFLQALRLMEHQGLAVSKAATTAEMTPRRAIGLMLRRRETLTKEESLALGQVCQLHPHINRAHALFQQCVQMLRFHSGEELESWMQAAFHSTIPELRSFVNKLCQDQAAVQAGLTLKWKNGMVEGYMNRIKFLKRSMYGRANFDLLRLRVLPHRKCA